MIVQLQGVTKRAGNTMRVRRRNAIICSNRYLHRSNAVNCEGRATRTDGPDSCQRACESDPAQRIQGI